MKIVVKTERETHHRTMEPRSMGAVVRELERRGIDLSRPFTMRVDRAAWLVEAEQEDAS